jgi:type I restriction enzyme M protein
MAISVKNALKLLFKNRERSQEYSPQKGKHRFVSRNEIVDNDYDLCERIYLSGYEYPSNVPLRPLGELFDITKGSAGAAQAEDGPFSFITSSEETKFHSSYSFDGEAICIPLVSSTGHGHASMKTIHYVNGKFEAATIVAVMTPKPGLDLHVPYIYYYLLSHKDELLVPLMRGAANVSLSIERLARLRVPVPQNVEEQKVLVETLENANLDVSRFKLRLKLAKENVATHIAMFRETF